MNITYDGKSISSANRLVTFTDVPNILKLVENITGYIGTFSFIFQGNLQQTVTSDGQYYITFLDETITNVMNPNDAKNKRFYISSDPNSTAVSVAQALRCCPSIAAQFNVAYGDEEVELQGKTIGRKWTNVANYFDTNIPASYMYTTQYDGSAYPEDIYMSKVLVDVVDGDKYLTTLEKNFYGNECAFDMSPVLSTISEYGEVKPYQFIIGTIAQYGNNAGKYTQRETVSGYTTPGYQANQSDRYMLYNTANILLNNNRDQIRYVYGQTIPFSVFGSGSITVSYTVKNSAMVTLTSSTETISSGGITDVHNGSGYTIPQSVYTNASYVDISANTKSFRFKVIKPLKATEYYQRILWRNEYGGIEFFDFTGKRSESDSVDIETYEKNIFDFYSNPAYELKKIYSNDYKKQVKLTSHLLEADGRWFANSLMRSKKVWTVINGKTHYIIPKNISVEEDGTYNNIYTVELTYEYSQLS